MSIILDLLGAAVIGSMLILMLITFQYSMHEAADRALYTMNMVDHMDMCAAKFNNVIALCGIGFNPTVAITHASPDSLVFRTYWNFETDQITASPVTLSIKLASAPNPFGTAVELRQDGVLLTDLGQLFWINELEFRYFTKTDVYLNPSSNTAAEIAAKARCVEVRLCFFRNPPRSGGRPIETKLQFKCYLMNAYMRGA